MSERAWNTSGLAAEIRQALAELELVSHAPIPAYGGVLQAGSDEDRGGKRPPGSDVEWKPRMPASPRIEGDAASEKAWDAYQDELAAWLASYHRRTVTYFRNRLFAWGVSAELLAEIRRTVESWKRTPIPVGQEPEYGSPQWKRHIADSDEDAGVLATRFHCTRRYINMVRKQEGVVTRQRADEEVKQDEQRKRGRAA